MKRTLYKILFGLIEKIFIVLLSNIVNVSNHTKCISLSNQKFQIQPTLINLHVNEYNQELHYYPFTVTLDKCVGSCNTHNDLCNKVYVPNKTEDLNLNVWNPSRNSCENGKYLASIMDNSAIICDEAVQSYEEKTNFNEKNATCKTQNFCILLAFLLITITLLIAVSIYCYLIKYRAKQKHLLPFHFTNNKLKENVY